MPGNTTHFAAEVSRVLPVEVALILAAPEHQRPGRALSSMSTAGPAWAGLVPARTYPGWVGEAAGDEMEPHCSIPTRSGPSAWPNEKKGSDRTLVVWIIRNLIVYALAHLSCCRSGPKMRLLSFDAMGQATFL